MRIGKVLIKLFVLSLVIGLTGCFSNRDYSVDYQVPNFFHYSITGTTNGLGDKPVIFRNNVKNSAENNVENKIRGAITDTSFYNVSSMKVKIYDYDTSKVGGHIATLYPTFSDNKLICTTNESHEAKLKLSKQVLIQVEATRGGKTIVILEKVVYNGPTHSGQRIVEIDFFTFTESLIYKAWSKLYPTMDYADFVHNLKLSNTYMDLAVEGVKTAIGEWNNFDYIQLEYDLAEPSHIAKYMKAEKCHNLYCEKIPQLAAGGIFAGIRARDIKVSVINLAGEFVASSRLEPDGSFSFSLPEKNGYYSIEISSEYTEHKLVTGVIGKETLFNANYLLNEKEFFVR